MAATSPTHGPELLHTASSECIVRNMAPHRTITPGHKIVYPNRDKASSKATKAIVILILLVSVGLMLTVTIGGWSKLQGLKPVNLAWCIIYLIFAFYIARWKRRARAGSIATTSASPHRSRCSAARDSALTCSERSRSCWFRYRRC